MYTYGEKVAKYDSMATSVIECDFRGGVIS